MSGWRRVAAPIAAAASLASPTTTKPSASSASRTPRRNAMSSSATRTDGCSVRPSPRWACRFPLFPASGGSVQRNVTPARGRREALSVVARRWIASARRAVHVLQDPREEPDPAEQQIRERREENRERDGQRLGLRGRERQQEAERQRKEPEGAERERDADRGLQRERGTKARKAQVQVAASIFGVARFKGLSEQILAIIFASQRVTVLHR